MTNHYKNYIHPDFCLNGQKFTIEDLLNYAQILVTLENDHEKFLGELILEWFNDLEFIYLTTSGTTGKPKKIKLQKQAMIESAFATNSYFKIPGKAKALHCLPVQYIAGKMMFIRSLILGWDLTYIKPESKPLQNFKNTFDFVAMVPLQVENSLDQLNQVKQIIIGGAKIGEKLREDLLKYETEIYETYGMTETVTHIAAKLISENYFNALPNVDFFVDDRNCLGISAPRVSNEKIQTNDIVELISSKEFVWLGRFDNVINSGGVKLFPEKIEEKLQHYIKNRFFVGGIPDSKLGFKLVIVIEGEKEFVDFSLIPTLNKFEIPKEVFFLPRFLETETSKLKRKEMLKLFIRS